MIAPGIGGINKRYSAGSIWPVCSRCTLADALWHSLDPSLFCEGYTVARWCHSNILIFSNVLAFPKPREQRIPSIWEKEFK